MELSRSLVAASLLALLAAASGCALVGYDLGEYGPADAKGAAGGGGGGSGTGGQGGFAEESESAGGQGSQSVSTSSGGTIQGRPCTDVTQCDDMDACTTDSCDASGHCAHARQEKCCAHSVCSQGGPLDASGCEYMDPMQGVNCVADICGSLPRCCAEKWDESCVDKAKTQCPANDVPSYTCGCEHSYCELGKALARNCDPCVHAVCHYIPSCCTPEGSWTSDCVALTHAFCHVRTDLECQ